MFNFIERNYSKQVLEEDKAKARVLIDKLYVHGWRSGAVIDGVGTDIDSMMWETSGLYNKYDNTFVFWLGSIKENLLDIRFRSTGDKYPGGTAEDLNMIKELFSMEYNYALKLSIQSDVTREYVIKFGMDMENWTDEELSEYNGAIRHEFDSRKKLRCKA